MEIAIILTIVAGFILLVSFVDFWNALDAYGRNDLREFYDSVTEAFVVTLILAALVVGTLLYLLFNSKKVTDYFSFTVSIKQGYRLFLNLIAIIAVFMVVGILICQGRALTNYNDQNFEAARSNIVWAMVFIGLAFLSLIILFIVELVSSSETKKIVEAVQNNPEAAREAEEGKPIDVKKPKVVEETQQTIAIEQKPTAQNAPPRPEKFVEQNVRFAPPSQYTVAAPPRLPAPTNAPGQNVRFAPPPAPTNAPGQNVRFAPPPAPTNAPGQNVQ